MKRPALRTAAGFTLVELIVVIVLVGIIGGVLTLQLKPAIQSYLLVQQRAALTSQADTALRRIVADVRGAVPNSLRLGSDTCLELVPTIDGGRFCTAPETGSPPVASAYLDDIDARNAFDVLTPLSYAPRKGDAIVVGNQNPDDVYDGANVAFVEETVATASAAGMHRIRLSGDFRLPPGYDGGRFVIVPGDRKVVYTCRLKENGTGTLYRFTAARSAAPSCTPPGDAAPVTAMDRVSACAFAYSPGQGATQESGYIQLQLTLSDQGESVPLTVGAHVDNVP